MSRTADDRWSPQCPTPDGKWRPRRRSAGPEPPCPPRRRPATRSGLARNPTRRFDRPDERPAFPLARGASDQSTPPQCPHMRGRGGHPARLMRAGILPPIGRPDDVPRARCPRISVPVGKLLTRRPNTSSSDIGWNDDSLTRTLVSLGGTSRKMSEEGELGAAGLDDQTGRGEIENDFRQHPRGFRRAGLVIRAPGYSAALAQIAFQPAMFNS
jgi:hypothetical protein